MINSKNKTINPKQRNVRVPIVIQMEELECGVACLSMILAYCGKYVTLDQLREDCNISRDGVSVITLKRVAAKYGLSSTAYKCGSIALRTDSTFPCIILWNRSHFVVLRGFTENKALLVDPAKGAYSVSIEEFENSYSGIVMYFKPNENFEPGGKPKSLLEVARAKLYKSKSILIFNFITLVITTLVSLISPMFNRVFMDYLLTGKQLQWLMPFIFILSMFMVIQVLMQITNTITNYKIQGKYSVSGSSDFFSHILKMPMKFFNQRTIGDLQNRQTYNESISLTFINTLVPIGINFIMMIFYLVVIIRYSLLLTFVGLLSIAINMICNTIVASKQMQINRIKQRSDALLSNFTLSGLSMVETIKSSGSEDEYFSLWSDYQAQSSIQALKSDKLKAYVSTLSSFLSSIFNTGILCLGVWLILRGHFTIGLFMAFQTYLQRLMSPAQSLISSNSQIIQTKSQIERIDDVLNYPIDQTLTYTNAPYREKKLSGNIKLTNVAFRYSIYSPLILKNINIDIKQGSKIAFVGTTGSGKSTLANVISGLYTHTSGQILYDGKEIEEINRMEFLSSIAIVNQEIDFFEGSISENISMFDPSIKNYDVILACKDACIHDEIMQMANNYHHIIKENGCNLSGGQRQRLEIARALATDPSILILDEATSSLDAVTENQVINAITNRGITCIIVAHRLSSIVNCDCIYMIENGSIVESGTHNSLIKQDGKYKKLIEEN